MSRDKEIKAIARRINYYGNRIQELMITIELEKIEKGMKFHDVRIRQLQKSFYESIEEYQQKRKAI